MAALQPFSLHLIQYSIRRALCTSASDAKRFGARDSEHLGPYSQVQCRQLVRRAVSGCRLGCSMNQTPIVSLPHTHTHSQSPTDRTRPCPCRCWQFGSSHHAGHTISVKYWSVWKWIVSVLFGSCFYCRLGCFSQPTAAYAGRTANKKKNKKNQ